MKVLGGKFAVVLLGPMVLAGCSACQVQIWGNSDSNDSKLYTRRTPHYVHVGETLDLRILVQPDTADYVLIDLDGQSFLTRKVNAGEYAFSRRFDRDARDTRMAVVVRAYRQRGRPDVLVENGKIRLLAASDDPTDELLGSTAWSINCYQSKAVVRFKPSDGKEPEWSRVALELYSPNNRISTIRRASPDAEGFTPLGCDAWGNYTVFYEPKLDEICRTGTTRAVLIVPDPAGKNDRRHETWIDTP